ncbi:MAG: hypothetical protein K0B11_05355 [Mariniphaga sp.]|nr:hypothetical protein [Mariniphaga sp.]
MIENHPKDLIVAFLVMGHSFVWKVSPVRFHGIIQSGRLLVTEVGNKLLEIVSYLKDRLGL